MQQQHPEDASWKKYSRARVQQRSWLRVREIRSFAWFSCLLGWKTKGGEVVNDVPWCGNTKYPREQHSYKPKQTPLSSKLDFDSTPLLSVPRPTYLPSPPISDPADLRLPWHTLLSEPAPPPPYQRMTQCAGSLESSKHFWNKAYFTLQCHLVGNSDKEAYTQHRWSTVEDRQKYKLIDVWKAVVWKAKESKEQLSFGWTGRKHVALV